jgi:hypothetical protein
MTPEDRNREQLAAIVALVEGVVRRGPGQAARLRAFADALERGDPAERLHPNLGVFLLRLAEVQADPARRRVLEEIADHFCARWFKPPETT